MLDWRAIMLGYDRVVIDVRAGHVVLGVARFSGLAFDDTRVPLSPDDRATIREIVTRTVGARKVNRQREIEAQIAALQSELYGLKLEAFRDAQASEVNT